MALTVASLQRTLSGLHHTSSSKYVVAFSGGLDSTVLLHAMRALGLSLHAVHINHHLQPQSDQWEHHCKEICNAWNVAFSARHIRVKKRPRRSIEEDAREERYRKLAEFIGTQDVLVTAHHKNDLAETVLLQLLRGAGPTGLSAMAVEQNFSFNMHLRPLLGHTRKELFEYAQQHALHWIEDVSNESLEFDRNYLREEIMPGLVARWPGTLQTLARAADLQAHAASCLQDLANLDVRAAATDDSRVLNAKVLQKLGYARLNNALRGWVKNHAMRVPSKKVLDRIATDVVYKNAPRSSPVQTWKEGEIRRYRNRIYLMQPLSEHNCNQEYRWEISRPLHIASLDRILQPADLDRYGIIFPEGTREVTVRFRNGGERLRSFGGKHSKSLKKFFQETGVPPWKRDRIPLLYHNDRLISVLGFWNAPVHCETS